MSESDHDQAAREAPWLHPGQPPSAADLIQFALWRSGRGGISEETALAALALLPAGRGEVDQIEAALLFTARARDLSWLRISQAMGLRSAQAAQHRPHRERKTAIPLAFNQFHEDLLATLGITRGTDT